MSCSHFEEVTVDCWYYTLLLGLDFPFHFHSLRGKLWLFIHEEDIPLPEEEPGLFEKACKIACPYTLGILWHWALQSSADMLPYTSNKDWKSHKDTDTMQILCLSCCDRGYAVACRGLFQSLDQNHVFLLITSGIKAVLTRQTGCIEGKNTRSCLRQLAIKKLQMTSHNWE